MKESISIHTMELPNNVKIEYARIMRGNTKSSVALTRLSAEQLRQARLNQK